MKEITRDQIKRKIEELKEDFIKLNPKMKGLSSDEIYNSYLYENQLEVPLSGDGESAEWRIKSRIEMEELQPEKFKKFLNNKE
ncbi:peptide ABC transporter [Sphingobacterium spiritivorum]|uniref:peptide ABC transporter n=1 Tax=Sphingobacterium spiritivorum TaxID=258 RepID=UPI00191B458F|nr:peptide ABC transporter [Sphingobacterium spiritivorum]QQT26803.1 peptide ABC transporter [Sphingobacterium spiritivorum]